MIEKALLGVILIVALVFRALPHSVLVAGYLPVFINSAEILRPILGENAPTLYGQPLAVIAVLVAINQPFTIWMLRSFFQNIPAELDEVVVVTEGELLEDVITVVEVDQRQGRAIFGKAFGNRPADALGSPGDEGGPAREVEVAHRTRR